ncbi:universal stress protein [Chengkuizengella axinellae]|uniref:Universal stress protein n=1 Tax=Chengkuizengella axinellae TaxID=3064388 RepID=A0ABT9IYX0_9BACL|nr:universal stress protein [Chengkuizengella sp. 2205SS18-9]MDP5274569.1 universal stress protein [Chengkuizengella sp. 2205SS18-9]
MFNKIMLAIDGSEHAQRAADKAIDLVKELSNASVTILHVVSKAPSRAKLLQSNFDVKSILKEEAHHILHSVEEKFKGKGVDYQFEVALGDASHEIVEYAEKKNYDLIIIGSRGLNALGEMLLGSVSHQVAHDAHCPVMIVK